MGEARWRIEQLAEVVARALSHASYDGQASGRVREVPDLRTIRYYTTLGILDRPCEMSGRTAYYGRRHVLQLVAIKRLQARGLSLVEVQRSLAGIDDAGLSRLAGLPEGLLDQLVGESVLSLESEKSLARSTRSAARDRFWADCPRSSRPGGTASERTGSDSPPAIRNCLTIRVDRGAVLLLEGAREDDVAESQLAIIEPVLHSLRRALRDAGFGATAADLGEEHGHDSQERGSST